MPRKVGPYLRQGGFMLPPRVKVSNITRPNGKLALHFDGPNGGTNFVDEYGHAISRSNSPVLDSGTVKFGSASGKFVSASDQSIFTGSSTAFAFGTSSFNLRLWINPGTASATPRLMGNLNSGAFGANKWTIATASNGVQLYVYNINTGSPILSSSSTGLTGWHLVSIARNGSNWYLGIDGTIQATTTSGASMDGGGAQVISIGSSGRAAENFNGYIDDLLLEIGTAYDTSNFTAPTQAFDA